MDRGNIGNAKLLGVSDALLSGSSTKYSIVFAMFCALVIRFRPSCREFILPQTQTLLTSSSIPLWFPLLSSSCPTEPWAAGFWYGEWLRRAWLPALFLHHRPRRTGAGDADAGKAAFELELHDPVLERTLKHRYSVASLPVIA